MQHVWAMTRLDHEADGKGTSLARKTASRYRRMTPSCYRQMTPSCYRRMTSAVPTPIPALSLSEASGASRASHQLTEAMRPTERNPITNTWIDASPLTTRTMRISRMTASTTLIAGTLVIRRVRGRNEGAGCKLRVLVRSIGTCVEDDESIHREEVIVSAAVPSSAAPSSASSAAIRAAPRATHAFQTRVGLVSQRPLLASCPI